jgi:hypothetical protein
VVKCYAVSKRKKIEKERERREGRIGWALEAERWKKEDGDMEGWGLIFRTLDH